MLLFFYAVSLCSLLLTPRAAAEELDVCFVGYVMDTYCIQRGTLLDKPQLQTREHPASHSVHCLVDVSACRGDTYELLKDPDPGDKIYCSAYTLDDNGQDMVIEHARSVGDCGTCDGGGQEEGYRATITGTVAASGGGKAPLLTVTKVEPASTGCPGGATEPDADTLDCSTGDAYRIAHASLMLIGWGFMIPAGVISARLLKYKEGGLWFQRHRWVQMCGLFIALVGFIIALARFDVFAGSAGSTAFVHGAVGIAVMALGALQPVNAWLRPHPRGEGEEVTAPRKLWEILHKGFGYGTVLLSVAAICLGVVTIGGKLQLIFAITYACFVGLLICYIIKLLRAKNIADSGNGMGTIPYSNPNATPPPHLNKMEVEKEC
jgi:hypothetical protein